MVLTCFGVGGRFHDECGPISSAIVILLGHVPGHEVALATAFRISSMTWSDGTLTISISMISS